MSRARLVFRGRVGGGSAPANTVLPAITGSSSEGQNLSCSTGTWSNSPTSYAYQWKRDGVNISSATSSSYLLVTADVGTMVSCAVTATNAAGSTSASASAVGPIVAAGAYTYDTSIGTGITNGLADLPLRTTDPLSTGVAAAKLIYVGNGGSDSTGTGTSHATRFATLAYALPFVTNFAGDQILIAEGSTFTASLPTCDYSGYSPAYPLVFQSYDPADPTNAAKFGRATTNRPKIGTAGASHNFLQGGGTSPNYLAIRGLDLDPGSVTTSLNAVSHTTGQTSYFLVENNVLRRTSTGYNGGPNPGVYADHHIYRANTIYSVWLNNGFGQGLYLDWVNHGTIEDNTFYHCGWNEATFRGDTEANGGGTYFGHSMYLQETCTNLLVRRNLIFDSISEAFSFRGDGVAEQNVGLRCANSQAGMGDGTNYDVARPGGVDLQVRYNAFLENENTPNPGSGGTFSTAHWGISATNGASGSSAHHNLLARATYQDFAFRTAAVYNVPSYMDYHHNVVDGWSSSGNTTSTASNFPAQCFPTYTNNYWDDPASGSNLNISSLTRPNRYTIATLISALGYANEAAFVSDLKNKPELKLARTILPLLQAGYAVDASGMVL